MTRSDGQRIGILITHGTDTLAWSLPFIRYAIKNNRANICLTGSQIPLPATAAFSDAFLNLENSVRFLSTLEPPNIFAVFNYGRDAFSDSLRKIDRWDCIAFDGDRVAQMEWDDIRYHDDSLSVVAPFKLDRLHVITTGGTIDAEQDDEGILSPGANHALGYIVGKFAHQFADLSRDPAMAIDSSDMTFERLNVIARKVEACLRESFDDAHADLAFEPAVRIIHTDPFKTRADYEREADGARGVVIAGYGGGNINIDGASGYALLPLVEAWRAEEIPVVLTSQVPRGPSDFVYANGSAAIRAGATPGVDLSIPECQVRLSFLLGHRQILEEAAERAGGARNWLDLLEMLFLSGVKFRNRASSRMLQALRPIPAAAEDLLVNRPFAESVQALADAGHLEATA